MKPSTRLLAAARGRTPLIHFLGPRKAPTEPHAHHPHYLAPPEAKGEAFEAFLQKLSAGTSGAASSGKASESTGDKPVFQHFWDVPNYSKFRLPELTDADIEQVMSGGASR